MDRVVVEALKALPVGDGAQKELFAWVGFRTRDGGNYRRAAGASSKFQHRKLWNFAFWKMSPSSPISAAAYLDYISLLVATVAVAGLLCGR